MMLGTTNIKSIIRVTPTMKACKGTSIFWYVLQFQFHIKSCNDPYKNSGFISMAISNEPLDVSTIILIYVPCIMHNLVLFVQQMHKTY